MKFFQKGMSSSKSSGQLAEFDSLPTVARQFEVAELHHLKRLFHELARRSPNPTISREHFLEFVQLPGLQGEQLFKAIDTNHTGTIDFVEFVSGLAVTCRGDRLSKMKFLFEMYDLQGDGSVSRAELQTMVNNLPRNMVSDCEDAGPAKPNKMRKNKSYLDFTNDDHVEVAFETCDLNRDGRLSWEQFQMWLERTPQVMDFFDQALANSLKPAEPVTPRSSSLHSQSMHRFPSDGSSISTDSSVRRQSSKTFALAKSEEGEPCCETYSGPLFKLGHKVGLTTKRHFSLVGNCLYYYVSLGDQEPRGLVFLGGCYADALEDLVAQHQGGSAHQCHGGVNQHGLRIQHLDAERIGERATTLYASSKQERDNWLEAIRMAIGESSRRVESVYTFGEKLGDGTFAQVYDAVEKGSCSNGQHYAIKKILKMKTADETEEESLKRREMFRMEISILRLTRHRHILSLNAVFEDSKFIHLVTPKLDTDLRKRILQTECFGEQYALKIAARLCDGVAYLHQLGILHRDLKPENILCDNDESFDSLRIGDFGISQILRPNETVMEAAGTMDYCAPEVFVREGCALASDVWSIGVIVCYILFGELPFTGETKSETVGYILEGERQVDEKKWSEAPAAATKFLDRLLCLDQKKRCTARDSLNDPWIKDVLAESYYETEPTNNAPEEPLSLDDSYSGLRIISTTSRISSTPPGTPKSILKKSTPPAALKSAMKKDSWNFASKSSS